MTGKQSALYWRTWARVRRVYIDLGGFSAAEAAAQRAALTTEALGQAKSSADLTNAELDRVLDAFRAVLTIPDGPATGPARADDMPRRRLVYAIERLGLEDAYLDKIAGDQFNRIDWRNMSAAQLRLLRMTAAARARARNKKEDAAMETVAETAAETAAEYDD